MVLPTPQGPACLDQRTAKKGREHGSAGRCSQLWVGGARNGVMEGVPGWDLNKMAGCHVGQGQCRTMGTMRDHVGQKKDSCWWAMRRCYVVLD